jgi:hypothetical protein
MGGVGTQTIAAQFRTLRFDGDTSTAPVLTGTPFAFTFTYDPNGGTLGLGAASLTIGGRLSTQGTDTGSIQLTAAQRASGITFDRFGIIPNIARTSGGGEFVYLDDLTYTIATPVTNAQWNVDASGSWSVSSNWLGGVPIRRVDGSLRLQSLPRRERLRWTPQTVGRSFSVTSPPIPFPAPSALTIDGPAATLAG